MSATATLRTTNRAARFFFMHLGSLVAVIVYFTLGNRAGWSVEGVRTALLVALVVKTGYMAVAWRQGELKHFDFALWTLFALGTVLTSAGVGWGLRLFRVYSPALVFTAFGLSAIGPLVLGWEPFTLYYARRQTPAWQQKAPQFAAITRVMAAFWALIFFVATLGCCVKIVSSVHKQTREMPDADDAAHVAYCLLLSLTAYAITAFFMSVAYTGLLPALAGLSTALAASTIRPGGAEVSVEAIVDAGHAKGSTHPPSWWSSSPPNQSSSQSAPRT